MRTLQLNDQLFPPVSRFPVEQCEALTALVATHPEALDLAFTNPPLAVALANAKGWDTFGLARVDRAFVGGLLRQRRRKICGVLGFPLSERVVRILAKVQPEACHLHLLARVRSSFRNPALLSILSHLPAIGATELRLVADLENCPGLNVALFTDLAVQLNDETHNSYEWLLRQTKTLLQRRDREFRSVQQVRRCYYRLWHELAGLENFDPTYEDPTVANPPFPAAPLPGIDDIQPINSAAALVEEARAMGHCVLSYAERVAMGDTYLYRVMAPERATFSITLRGTAWQIGELGGVQNQRVSGVTEDLIESWLRSTQAAISHE